MCATALPISVIVRGSIVTERCTFGREVFALCCTSHRTLGSQRQMVLRHIINIAQLLGQEQGWLKYSNEGI